jgi:hypothetical protein|tara:strand:+ start:288 stop:1142 length:855 start_codon:yes stop_codon:yes gene_type:complete
MPLTKKSDAGDYVDDFQKSKAPQFKGKSKKKRRDMAIAAYLSNKNELAELLREVIREKKEVLNEISVLGFLKNLGKETIANIKNKILKVFNTAKEEGGETLEMFKLLAAKKKGKKLTPQQQKLIDDQSKDLIKMAVLGTAAASAFSALPLTAAAATLVSIISFLDLDDDLLSYTDSSKDSARSLTEPEKNPKNFKDIQGVKYIKYDAVAPYLNQADAVAEETDINTENFKDGKKKGKSRPGRVKKSGASCKGSVSSLRAKAKKYGGEKGKMYHWCANMKGGKKK